MGDQPPLLVGAIDFGTTYSGWAYSFENDIKSINSTGWKSQSMLTEKTPTTLLIKPDGKSFDSFGYKAMRRYSHLSPDEQQKYFYFHRFKMKLYKNVVDRNIFLNDETNKSLSAKTVFSLAIKYLVKNMIKAIKDALDLSIEQKDVMWVLTIPAIWDDAAKQFMREVAIEAGITDKQLMLALEPEAASIFCQLKHYSKMELKKVSFTPGSKYMLIDAGGGTVDISVHEVLEGGALKELHEASGGGWGGIQVDEEFIQYISNLTGKSSFDKLKKENPSEYLELLFEFEKCKRGFKKETTSTIWIPSPFRGEIEKGIHSKMVKFNGDKLQAEASKMKEFFSGPIGKIVKYVKQLMGDSNVNEIKFILMVGGFSMCKLLQDEIRSSLEHINVIIHPDANLAVAKGAVLYGYNPAAITQRVCKNTYGIGTCKLFDPKEHDEKKKVSYDGILYCSDLFDVHVNVGETVKLDEIQSEQSYVPTMENQESVALSIYRSSEKNIKYVTDERCHKLGTITVNISNRSVPRQDREVIVSMIFSGTEIKVSAKEKRTGKPANACVDFLSENQTLKFQHIGFCK